MIRRLIYLVLILASVNATVAQSPAVISGQVVSLQGIPTPYATVRICPQTATGTPCVPLATIYSDPALAHKIANPTTADQNGLYSVFVDGSTAFYQVQTSPTSKITYNYYANGFNSGGGGTINPGSTYVLSQYSNSSGSVLFPSQVFLDQLSGQNMTVGTGAGNGSIKSAAIGGSRYATQWGDGSTNGIASAAAIGQVVVADPTYGLTEYYSNNNSSSHPLSMSPSQGVLQDWRQGQLGLYGHDPAVTLFDNTNSLLTLVVNSTTQQGSVTYGRPRGLNLYGFFQAPGYNFGTAAKGPTNWTTGGMLTINQVDNTPGIFSPVTVTGYKPAVGDTANYFYNWNYGGQVDQANEGNHPLAWQGIEANTTYKGTVTTGGSGATTIKVTCTTDCGPNFGGPGGGRYLVETGVTADSGFIAANPTNPSGSTPGTFAIDHSITPSTATGTMNGDCNAGAAPTPIGTGYNTVTCNVTVTSGAFAAGSSLVCFAGLWHEQALITNTGGGTALTMNLRHTHKSGDWIGQGGPCGQYLDITVNDQTPAGVLLHYPIDIVGAPDATHLYWAFFYSGQNQAPTSGWGNLYTTQIASTNLSNVGGTVYFTCSGCAGTTNLPFYTGGVTVTFSGSAVAAYNGTCTNTQYNVSTNLFSCTQAGSVGAGTSATATITNGTSQYGNGAYVTWQGAETLDVLDHTVNPPVVNNGGQTAFTVEPNNGAWAASTAVEQAHHYALKANAFFGTLQAFDPYLIASSAVTTNMTGGAMRGGSLASPFNGYNAYIFTNAQPTTYYSGHGGTISAPGGIVLGSNGGSGIFQWGLNMFRAPDPIGSPVIYSGCPLSGCTDANYFYNVFQMTGNGGNGTLVYRPFANELSFGGGPLVLNTDLGAQTFRGPVTLSPLAVPTVTLTTSTGTGGLSDVTSYCYRVTAINTPGENVPNAETCITTGTSGGTNSITVKWTRSIGATQYRVYCRTTGAEQRCFQTSQGIDALSWVDTGAVTPSGAIPTSDTSRGYVDQAAKLCGNSSGTAFTACMQAPASAAASYTLTLPATATAANLVDEAAGTTTAGNVATYANSTGRIQDSGTSLSSLAPKTTVPATTTCGTTTTCANTAQASPRIVHGNVALTAGSAVVGSMTAWTSTTSFDCTGTDTTSTAAVKIVNTSTTSITITGTGTDVIAYICVGN